MIGGLVKSGIENHWIGAAGLTFAHMFFSLLLLPHVHHPQGHIVKILGLGSFAGPFTYQELKLYYSWTSTAFVGFAVLLVLEKLYLIIAGVKRNRSLAVKTHFIGFTLFALFQFITNDPVLTAQVGNFFGFDFLTPAISFKFEIDAFFFLNALWLIFEKYLILSSKKEKKEKKATTKDGSKKDEKDEKKDQPEEKKKK